MYRHTQIGYAMIVLGLIPVAILARMLWPTGRSAAAAPLVPLAIIVGVVLFVGFVSFMTVSVDNRNVSWSFGPGIFKRTIALSDVVEAQTVVNPWYSGWGIRWAGGGWLYNVSGFQAVAIRTKNGGTTRLGTDDPDHLLAAILERVPGIGQSPAR